MKRLRQLEKQNGKLKTLVADLSVDKAMLQGQGVLLERLKACAATPVGG